MKNKLRLLIFVVLSLAVETAHGGIPSDEGTSPPSTQSTHSLTLHSDSGFSETSDQCLNSPHACDSEVKDHLEFSDFQFNTLINGLQKSLDKNYRENLKGFEELKGFLSYGEPDGSELTEADKRTYARRIFISTSSLKNIQTIYLIKHLNHLAQEGIESFSGSTIRDFFSQVDYLSIRLSFWRWNPDRLRGLNTHSIKMFISLFPNLKKLRLHISGLIRDFEFPIPDSLTTLEELDIFLPAGMSYAPTGDYSAELLWQNSWTDLLLKAIDRNTKLIRLNLEVPAVSAEYVDHLKNILIQKPDLKELRLTDPREGLSFTTLSDTDLPSYDKAVRNLFKEAHWIKPVGKYSGR